MRDVLPDEADDLLRGRFAIIQVWRPIRHPVETHPLGIADARSVDAKDFIISERIYPNRVGQTYAVGLQSQRTIGTGSRACGATRRWCSRYSISARTAAPAGPRTPRSTIRPRRPTHARARASKSGRWRFSRTAGALRDAAVARMERSEIRECIPARGAVRATPLLKKIWNATEQG